MRKSVMMTPEELEAKHGMSVAEVDFSDSLPNPYVGKARRRVTINIDSETIDYFKAEARRTGVPYQNIINMYLAECRDQEKHLAFT